MGRLARIVNVFFVVLAVCLVVGMAIGGWVFYKHRRADDADASFKRVAKAQALLEELEGVPAAGKHAEELEKARQTLLDARSLYNRHQYGASLKRAQEAMELLQPVKGEIETPREAAKVLASSGECGILRGAEGQAAAEAPAGSEIRVGETLRTRGDGACLATFPNGESVALHGASALRLDSLAAGTSGTAVELTLLEGTALFRCPSMVSADGAGRIVAGQASLTATPGSTFQVGLAGPESIMVEAHVGKVAVEAGGSRTEMRGGIDGKRVHFTQQGAGKEEALASPPPVVSPREWQVFRSKGGNPVQVEVRWEASRVRAVRMQVADNPLFARGVLVDRTLEGTGAVAPGLKEGQYFVRLRAADDPSLSFWSAPLRFRVISVPKETTEPAKWKLDVEAAPVGDSVLVKGSVKPTGVTVTVNDVEVPVDSRGQFYGTFALDPRVRKITVCAFDGKGGEKVWTKSY